VQGATITLTNAQAGDVLLAAGMPLGITATLSPGNTVVTLSGTASLTAYETAIRTIQFSNTSESPSTAVDRTITVVVNDGSASSNVGTTTIHVVAVNDAPTLDLDANNSAATGTAYATSYTENAAGVAIADSDALITDVDSANIRSASIRLVNAQAGDRLLAGGLPAGIVASSFDPVAGIITLSGDASLATFRTALRAVTFSSTSDDPGSSARFVEVTVNDGSSNSNTARTTISVVPINDAPVNTLPAAQTVNEDTARVFSAANGNAIRVADVDSSTLTTTLSIGNGTLTAVTSGGATLTGNGTSSVILSGTAVQINAALNGLLFTPAADYNGSATLSVSTSDGVAPAVVTTVGVTVTAVADIANDSLTTDEDTPININANANDTFENTGHTITAVNGTAIVVGGTVAVANGSVTLKADGTLDFSPVANYNNTAATPSTFTYTVTSGGVTETATGSVVVNSVNDAAVISAPMVSITETDAVLTTGGTLVITDVDSPATFVAQTNAAGSNGYGHFNLASNGVWTYTTDTAHNEFAAGTTYTDKLTVSSADGSISTITVNILGTNDAPLAADDIVITNIAPGQAISIPSSALISNDSDPDNGASLSLTAVSNALNGSVLGTSPVVFTNTSSFGPGAKIVAEAPLFPGDSETSGLNNTRALAYEIGRGQFGQVSAADAPYVGDASLPSFKWSGRIDDVSGTPANTDQDFLKVYLYAGEKITLDIDGADSGLTTIGSDQNAVDMLLKLYDANGVELAQNDDALNTLGGLGSVKSGYHGNSLDSYLQYTVAADGYYFIDATAFNNNASGINQDDGNYQLWVSIQPTAATHPSSFDYTLSDGLASDSAQVSVNTVQASLISGGNANEILIGGSGNDTLDGGAGKDNLIGGSGNDVLIGNAGNDTMSGDLGADVFQWHFADRGATGAPAIDTLTDFSLAPSASGGDILDLRDLLQGELHAGVAAGNLANYLHFDVAGGVTTVQISSSGGFNSGYNATAVDQQIVLAGVDLSAGGLTSDQLIIQDLLTKGKLVTD
jgi:VCBS repeat-containing protein